MAGFKKDEPRDADGKWTSGGDRRSATRARWYHDPNESPHDAGLRDLAVTRREALDRVHEKKRAEQLGEAFKPKIGAVRRSLAKGLVLAHKGAQVYERNQEKFYKTRFGKFLAVLGKDRFTGVVPPGSKRDAAVRTLASVMSLGLSGGLSALSPTWAAGKAMRAADWGIKAHAYKAAKKAARETKNK